MAPTAAEKQRKAPRGRLPMGAAPGQKRGAKRERLREIRGGAELKASPQAKPCSQKKKNSRGNKKKNRCLYSRGSVGTICTGGAATGSDPTNFLNKIQESRKDAPGEDGHKDGDLQTFTWDKSDRRKTKSEMSTSEKEIEGKDIAVKPEDSTLPGQRCTKEARECRLCEEGGSCGRYQKQKEDTEESLALRSYPRHRQVMRKGGISCTETEGKALDWQNTIK